jgi:hypothetical protein
MMASDGNVWAGAPARTQILVQLIEYLPSHYRQLVSGIFQNTG